VAFVFDVFSRRILGWRAATSMTTDLVLADRFGRNEPRTSPCARSCANHAASEDVALAPE